MEEFCCVFYGGSVGQDIHTNFFAVRIALKIKKWSINISKVRNFLEIDSSLHQPLSKIEKKIFFLKWNYFVDFLSTLQCLNVYALPRVFFWPKKHSQHYLGVIKQYKRKKELEPILLTRHELLVGKIHTTLLDKSVGLYLHWSHMLVLRYVGFSWF